VAENLYYLASLPDTGLIVWVIRGFGTAILHGGTVPRSTINREELEDEQDSDEDGQPSDREA